MDEATTTPKTAAQYRAAIDDMLAEMRQMNETSRDTWEEIDRLKAESDAIHASSDVIAAQTDRRLESLTRLLDEMESDRELNRLRHENLMLRLDNILLRFERRLPPGTPPNELGTEQS